MPAVIATENLSKVYGKTVAVHNLNLSLQRGQIFGFLGLNGAGKTTTIRMLLGLVSPSQGRCFLQGVPIVPGEKEIWRQVGYLVETPQAYPELTVQQNLELISKLRGIKEKNRLWQVLEELKLTGQAHKKTKQLSRGNGQRLGLAKALIHKPQILLLDEPTTGLDPAGSLEIRGMLQDLARRQGVTILISSHRLDEISRLATNIGIIHQGRLVRAMTSLQLAKEVQKILVLDGKDRRALQAVLAENGFKSSGKKEGPLAIADLRAVENPQRIAQLLVEAGQPPTLLQVVEEDLQEYFLRVLREAGGDLDA